MEWEYIILNVISLISLILSIISLASVLVIRESINRDVRTTLIALKNYRTDMDKAFEIFKSSVQQTIIDREATFKAVHGEQIEALKALHTSLSASVKAFRSFTSQVQMAGDVPLDIKEEIALKRFRDFKESYEEKHIYIDNNICDKIDLIVTIFDSAIAAFPAENPLSSYERTLLKDSKCKEKQKLLQDALSKAGSELVETMDALSDAYKAKVSSQK